VFKEELKIRPRLLNNNRVVILPRIGIANLDKSKYVNVLSLKLSTGGAFYYSR
jgi:hypothetical protein